MTATQFLRLIGTLAFLAVLVAVLALMDANLARARQLATVAYGFGVACLTTAVVSAVLWFIAFARGMRRYMVRVDDAELDEQFATAPREAGPRSPRLVENPRGPSRSKSVRGSSMEGHMRCSVTPIEQPIFNRKVQGSIPCPGSNSSRSNQRGSHEKRSPRDTCEMKSGAAAGRDRQQNKGTDA